MENTKNTDPNQESDWFDDILNKPQQEKELGPDEKAVFSAGLSDLSDMEFEKIMQETLNEQWDPDAPVPEDEEDPLSVESEEYRNDYTDEGVLPEKDAEQENEEEPEEEEEPEDPTKPARKVRPKRKKGYGLFGIPHLISTAIWLALAIFIGVSLGRLLWICATDILAFGRDDRVIYVTITDSDDIDSITTKLHDAGLIKYPQLFLLYADLSNAEEDISVGTFKLNSLYDYHALVAGMSATSSYRESVEVLIPEGYSCAQIFKLLEEKGVCTVDELEEYASESEFADYWFLKGAKRGNKYTLEGFLFPDTYEFYTNDSPRRVFIKMLDRFENQLEDEVETHLEALNLRLAEMLRKNGYDQDYIDKNMLTLYDVIKVASMIEKESANTGENYNISSVIYNRLTNQREFPYLQIDATIVYALGGKSGLTAEDLKYDSPYNTYLYGGLPPTPISNPGKTAILAALSPADTGYYYYALNPATGEHHFTTNLKDHQDFLNSLG